MDIKILYGTTDDNKELLFLRVLARLGVQVDQLKTILARLGGHLKPSKTSKPAWAGLSV